MGRAGEVKHAAGFDSELQRLDAVFRPVCDVQSHDRVLDVGCGTGQTTRAAARAAHEGGALGVDTSAPAIERARELAEGLGNVSFERGDAEVHPFPTQSVDLVISRFGTMFFHDAGAAFTNLARALRPGGRLVMLVWQAGGRNEWHLAIREALGGAAPSAAPPAFSLADPSRTAAILEAAGFAEIEFTEVEEQVFYGPDVPAAEAWVRSFTSTRELLDHTDGGQGLERLRETLSAHQRDDGVWFGSRAWIVTALRG